MNTSTKPLPLGLTLLILLSLLLGSALVVRPVIAADTITVINLDDSGAGSLRQAIDNISPNGIITFAPSLSGETITLSSTLNIQKNMKIYAGDLDQPVTISGNNVVRVFYVNDSVTNAELNHLTISHGKSLDIPVSTSGGGIFNLGHLTLINCTLSDNQTAWDAGAIYNGGTLNVENSHFIRNQSEGFGGAISNQGTMNVITSIFTENQSTDHHGGGIGNGMGATIVISASSFTNNSAGIHGGGIINWGFLTVENSTLSGNIAKGEDSDGGGIYNTGTATITNSTLSGNMAEGDFSFGGGIMNYGNLTLTNSTLFGNKVKIWGGGGIFNSSNANLNYTNTIITHSVGGDCRNSGTITNSTHNLVRDGSCYVATNLSGDPKLGPLQDNGGPTLTHALLPGSPAIDTGSDAHSPDFDQRGVPRPQDGDGDGVAHCDIGAFELASYHLVVINSSDNEPGSLRKAIADIQPGGRITFSSSLSGQTITLASPLQIDKNLTIDGSGLAVPITISGNNAVGVFNVGPSVDDATLESLKIIRGNRGAGGGIFNMGALMVTNCTVSDNNAQEDGGGIYNMGELTILNSTLSGNNATDSGGGIYNLGVMELANSTLFGNSAIFGGGIFNLDVRLLDESTFSVNMSNYDAGIFNDEFSQRLDVINSTLSGNTAVANGGGIFNLGELWIIDSTISGNQAFFKGGGVFNNGTLVVDQSTFSANNADLGGGIRNDEGTQSNITVNDSTFFENEASHGGAIDNWGDGPNLINNSSLIDNTATANGGAIRNWSALTVENSTLSDNSSVGNGGGIHNEGTLMVENSTLSENNAGAYGGGIRNEGTLTLLNVVLNGNEAVVGGGIANNHTMNMNDSTLSANSAYDGGGIYSTSIYLLTMTNCTLSGNTALVDGGGIVNVGPMTITNSTLSGNTAKRGGGILNDGSLNLLHVTLNENIAEQGNGGGIINFNGNTMKFINTIIAYSTGYDCVNSGTIHPDSTHNLVTDGDCYAMLDDDPMLGPLADNGGPTLTHALLQGSPAIDAGSNVHCPVTDQRGYDRPMDGKGDGFPVCDIGAFEFDPSRDGVSKIFLPLILR